jgi:hypothetical protein
MQADEKLSHSRPNLCPSMEQARQSSEETRERKNELAEIGINDPGYN